MLLCLPTPTRAITLDSALPTRIFNAMRAGELLGEGSYSTVFRYQTRAFKLCSDPATIALAQACLQDPVPGLPRVHEVLEDVGQTDRNDEWVSLIECELLTPVDDSSGELLESFWDAGLPFAERSQASLTAQSQWMIQHLVDELGAYQRTSLDRKVQNAREALCWLSAFVDEQQCCVDFGRASNWMWHRQRGLIVADPVVHDIRKLGATNESLAP